MYKITIGLLLAVFCLYGEEQEEVTTSITSELTFEKPTSATELFKGDRVPFGMWVNPQVWKKLQQPLNEDADLSFKLDKEDAYGMIIAERIKVPLDFMKEIVIGNAENAGSENVTIEEEEFRNVNGKEVLFIQWSGKLMGMDFVYMTYIFSGDEGTIQVITFTSDNLFEEYKNKMENFLNGFVILN